MDNLHFLVDWNDYGIDGHATSSVVAGTPEDWFAPHGWRVCGTEQGSDFASVTEVLKTLIAADEQEKRPSMAWFKTRKGRGYGKYDAASHGAPHAMNSAAYWELRKSFAQKYGAKFSNVDGSAPSDDKALQEEFRSNLEAVVAVMREDADFTSYLADRLVEIGNSVPETLPTYRLQDSSPPFDDPQFWDATTYPESLWAKPGESKANRAAMGAWGSYINALGRKQYNRPLFLAASADLSGSTNLSGFGSDWEDTKGYVGMNVSAVMRELWLQLRLPNSPTRVSWPLLQA